MLMPMDIARIENPSAALRPPCAAAQPVARTPWIGIALIAAAAFGLEMAVSARYGYVRDELYFLAAGQHLAFGYVDQPPITPLLARLSPIAGGNTLAAFRVVPALGLAALVILTSAMSRLLGAGRTGQILAALAAATCGEYLAAMHELTTTTPDFVFGAVTLLLVMRLLASRDARWWLAIGTCVGVASEAKWNIAFLAAALAAGFAVTDARPLLRSRYLVIGCLIAAALAAPDVIWQAVHGWPTLDVFRTLQTAAGHNRAVYWVAQVLYTCPVLTPVWVAGLIWSLRSDAARRFRPVAVACVIVIVLQFVLGGKPYYPGAAFTFLLAAGCVPLGRWPAARLAAGIGDRARGLDEPGHGGGRTGVAADRAARAPGPGPARRPRAEDQLRPRRGDRLADAGGSRRPRIRRAARSPAAADHRARRELRRGRSDRPVRACLGLPQVFSGHNNFWLWGPPPAADTSAIAVDMDPALLRREFAHVRQVATFWNGLGVSDDEQGAPVYLATGLKASWARSWPAFRDYS